MFLLRATGGIHKSLVAELVFVSEGGLVLYRDCCNIGNSVTKSLSTYSALTRLFGKVAIGSLCMHMAQDTGRLSCTTTLTIRPVSVTPAGNL